MAHLSRRMFFFCHERQGFRENRAWIFFVYHLSINQDVSTVDVREQFILQKFTAACQPLSDQDPIKGLIRYVHDVLFVRLNVLRENLTGIAHLVMVASSSTMTWWHGDVVAFCLSFALFFFHTAENLVWWRRWIICQHRPQYTSRCALWDSLFTEMLGWLETTSAART